MAEHTAVVLGGGTGGLVAARRLRRLLDPAGRVVVIDPSPAYQFAPSFLWVMTGARQPGHISAERARLGCGTGRFTASSGRCAAWLAGMDPGPAMRALAARHACSPLLAASACRVPFRDAALDVTIVVTLCESTASPALFVAELVRVTRPGGRIVIGAPNRRSPWGLARRRRLRRPPWQAARFLARRQLLALGSVQGRVTLQGALFAPGAVPGPRAPQPVPGGPRAADLAVPAEGPGQ